LNQVKPRPPGNDVVITVDEKGTNTVKIRFECAIITAPGALKQ